MSKLPRLGVFGTLNYELLTKLNDQERNEFVLKHTVKVLQRKTEGDEKGPMIAKDDQKAYKICCDFTVMDTRYNKRGNLKATIRFQQDKEGTAITKLESIEFCKTEN